MTQAKVDSAPASAAEPPSGYVYTSQADLAALIASAVKTVGEELGKRLALQVKTDVLDVLRQVDTKNDQHGNDLMKRVEVLTTELNRDLRIEVANGVAAQIGKVTAVVETLRSENVAGVRARAALAREHEVLRDEFRNHRNKMDRRTEELRRKIGHNRWESEPDRFVVSPAEVERAMSPQLGVFLPGQR